MIKSKESLVFRSWIKKKKKKKKTFLKTWSFIRENSGSLIVQFYKKVLTRVVCYCLYSPNSLIETLSGSYLPLLSDPSVRTFFLANATRGFCLIGYSILIQCFVDFCSVKYTVLWQKILHGR